MALLKSSPEFTFCWSVVSSLTVAPWQQIIASACERFCSESNVWGFGCIVLPDCFTIHFRNWDHLCSRCTYQPCYKLVIVSRNVVFMVIMWDSHKWRRKRKRFLLCRLFSWTVVSRTCVKVGTYYVQEGRRKPNSVNMKDVNEKKCFVFLRVLLRSVSLAVGYVAETLWATRTENITNVLRSLLYACALLVQ